MRHPALLLLLPICWLPLALPGSGAAVAAGTSPELAMPARVMGVRNGQELEVSVGERDRRVRLACIQAPRPQQQPWFDQASKRLRDALPPGSPVVLELRSRDVFNREVAVVRHKGADVAVPLLREGLVFAYDGYLGRCDDLGYPAVEAEARRNRRGVWRVEGGIERPWNLLQRLGDTDAEP